MKTTLERLAEARVRAQWTATHMRLVNGTEGLTFNGVRPHDGARYGFDTAAEAQGVADALLAEGLAQGAVIESREGGSAFTLERYVIRAGELGAWRRKAVAPARGRRVQVNVRYERRGAGFGGRAHG